VFSFATGGRIGVLSMTDQIVEIEDDEDDEDDYDRLLAAIGRTPELDQRVALHESGHAILSRLTTGDCSICLVTISPADSYEGQCRGARREAFVRSGVTAVDAVDASHVRKILQPLMPKPGEDRSDKADIYQNVFDACTQLMAGEAAEELLLEGEASFASDDRRQVMELAALICKTPQAVAAFTTFCKQQAHDMLSEYVGVLMSLSIALRIRRTMTGDEIDRAIAIVLAGEAAALERIRRKQWQRVLASAAGFRHN
jgi:hypothetical protein